MSDKLLAFKVTTVGNSEGFILPREARDRLGVRKGDHGVSDTSAGQFLSFDRA